MGKYGALRRGLQA